MSLAPSKDLLRTGNSRVLLHVGNCSVFVSAEHGWLAAQQWPGSTQQCTNATSLEIGISATDGRVLYTRGIIRWSRLEEVTHVLRPELWLSHEIAILNQHISAWVLGSKLMQIC